VGENRVVVRFRELASAALGGAVVVGPGDDAAVIRAICGRLLLVTCDMMVEGVHFRREWASPEQIGRKAMVQNLSDIAAMGGEPAAAVSSVAAPGDLDEGVVEGIARGLIAAASEYGAALVGGDLVGSPGPLVVDVALTGWVEEELMLCRRGARPGDAIMVTGSLGASAAGLAALQQGLTGCAPELGRAVQAHREPRPRLAEARAVAATRRATAMMDLSDGLADDLPRLCAESGVGARVWTHHLPVDACCPALAPRISRDAREMAMAGGEDYELVFTCPVSAVEAITTAVVGETGTAVTSIGEIVEGSGVRFLDASGQPVKPGSRFDHFAGRAR
jgi:thiamine-monophosphate kinase